MWNSVSGIYLSSSLSFSVYYSVFKPRMCNPTFEFILHLYSFFSCFLFFFIPAKGFCCRPKYWANIIHSFDYQNSLTSKCVENWALFERPNLSTASDRHYPHAPAPPGVCPTQSPRNPTLFLSSSRMHILAPFSARTHVRENISFSRRSTAFWGVYPAECPGNSLW